MDILPWIALAGLVGLVAGLLFRWSGACLLPMLLITVVTVIYVYDG